MSKTQLTPRCTSAIDYAHELGRRLGSPDITGAHVIGGLLSLQNGVAENILRAGGLSQEIVEKFLQSLPPQPKLPGHSDPKLDGLAIAALKEGEHEAGNCAHTYLGTEHLLLALLGQNVGAAANLFNLVGLDRRTAIFAILTELGFEVPTNRNTLLILEDSADRLQAFRSVLGELGPEWSVEVWRDAPSMIEEFEGSFDSVRLFSLDHDLNPQPDAKRDPGTGRHVTKVLEGFLPLAPVIIHSSNTDAAWSMYNDLRFAGWTVDRVGRIGSDWVRELWLPKAKEMVAANPAHASFRRHRNHAARFELALESLDGLAVADALGEMLAYRHAEAESVLKRGLPPAPWFHTDDTEMALSLVEVLEHYGHVHQDALSRRFAWRFDRDSDRGYGKMTRLQMFEIIRGGEWRATAAAAFGGQGSMGNGAAMRVAPLGAYFWDSASLVIQAAELSAKVTHTHPEAVAGAIAVAVAAAEAVRLRKEGAREGARRILVAVMGDTPSGKVRDRLRLAAEIPPNTNIHEVAKLLGNGSQVTAADTVPYAIWCAANNLDNYERAVITAITGGGDCDTNAAIVGGIVAAFTGRQGIPQAWLTAKEQLPFDS